MLRGLICLLLLIALTTLSGCETFKGMGRDIQKGGQAIEDAASK